MPNWQPNWQDVRWNYEASGRAASELRRAADAIDQATHDRSVAADEARREWRGPYRRRFDGYFQDATARASALAEEYRAEARRIDWASQRAREEQQRRVRERERWFREKEDEDRRQREQDARNRNQRR